MSKRSYLRGVAASIMFAVIVVVLPAVLVSSEEMPLTLNSEWENIYFSGVELSVSQADGSIQAKIDVWMREMWYGSGVVFRLKYDRDYIVPSDFASNEVKDEDTGGGIVARSDFFQHNTELLYDGSNPFDLTSDVIVANPGVTDAIQYGAWDSSDESIHMALVLDTSQSGNVYKATRPTAAGVEELDASDALFSPSYSESESLYRSGQIVAARTQGQQPMDFFFFMPEGFFDPTFDSTPEDNKHIKLGTLSFRVNPEKLQEMVSHFDGWTWNSVDNDPNMELPVSGGLLPDYLLKLTVATDTWTISGFEDESATLVKYTSNLPKDAYAMFDFKFNDSLIRAELAEREVTLNAYQAFTTGSGIDVAYLLQKYSPMLELAYANGAMKNTIMRWGMDYEASDGTVYPQDFVLYKDVGTQGAPDFQLVNGTTVLYDPRGGTYRAQQKYYYETTDADGNLVVVEFPQKISAIVNVTPVNVIGITAERLREIYSLDASTLDHYKTVISLRLPEEARIMTDVVSGASSLMVPVPGWKPDNNDMSAIADITDLVAADNVTPGAHWPTSAEYYPDPTDTIAKGRGTYGFVMSSNGTAEYKIDETDIRTVYPWLTVSDEYPLRAERILANEVYEANGSDYHDARFYEAIYKRSYSTPMMGQSETADDLTLELWVKRKASGGSADTAMTADTLLRMYLPDGTLVESGATPSGLVDADSWFKYGIGESVDLQTYIASSVYGAFKIVVKPGVTDASVDDTKMIVLDKLRSYINLGGWFALSVLETDVDFWSDLVYVYVPPRANEYLEDKDYVFSGPNAGLFPYISPFPQRVSVPQGTYLPVDISDNIIDPNSHVAYEDTHYGVAVTYDGVTGRQPGRVHQFEADDYWLLSDYPYVDESDYDTSDSTHPTPPAVTTTPISAGWKTDFNTLTNYPDVGVDLYRTIYGARYPMTSPYDKTNPFKADVRHSAIGSFKNNGKYSPMFVFDNANEDVTPSPTDPNAEKIIVLPYTGDASGLSTRADGTVRQVTFSTQTLGYTVREEYVLKIENVGTVDIHGLYIEMQRDYDGDATAQYGHSNYEIIDPPASFLPVGGETTFTIVYEYNLKDMSDDYLNKIFIGSNRTQVSDAAPWTYLAEFDASFRVTKEDTNHITLVIEPSIAGVEVGTAYVIKGEKNALTHEMPNSISDSTLSYVGSTPMNFEMDTTVGSYLQDAGRPVFIYIEGKDEYELASVTYRKYSDPSGATTAYEYGGVNDTAGRATVDAKTVYVFGMPDEDVIVTITFSEPISSKLRLGDLNVYASQDSTFTMDPSDPDYDPSDPTKLDDDKLQKLYKKVFTQDEKDNYTTDETIAWHGAAGEEGFTNMPDYNQYMVVLPTDAEYYLVEAILRKFVDAVYPGISGITVEMTKATSEGGSFAPFYTAGTGNTLTPSVHESEPQPSPALGKSHVVQISMSHSGSKRTYFVEVIRRPTELVADFGYGNSPFGMIMNDAAIVATVPSTPAGNTLTGKQLAKQAFINNGYRFIKDAAETPAVANSNNLFNMYNREAWAPLNQGFEPESAQRLYVYNSQIPIVSTDPNPYAPSVNVTDTHDNPATNNLDLNDYSLFVVPGEAFRDPGFRELRDSSMRVIADEEVSRYIEVVLLDTSATTQAARFGGPSTASFATYEDYMAAYRALLRTARIELGTIDTTTIAATWAKGYVALGTVDSDGNPQYAATATDLYIRPGVYQLVYEMEDYNGDPLKYTRDIIILPEIGDVNADGVLDATDEQLMESRFIDRLGYTETSYAKSYSGAPSGDAAIFKYRVLDTNNDRDINQIDSNEIYYRVKSSSKSQRYYIPTNYK